MSERTSFEPGKRKEEAYVSFGGASHESQYIFMTPNLRNEQGFIPTTIVAAITKTFQGTEWVVDNRGTRIEIHHRDYRTRDDEFVGERLKEAVGEWCDLVLLP